MDRRYKLFIAGQFKDQLTELYWNQQIKQMHLESSVVFQGWHTDLDTWLEDKNYILEFFTDLNTQKAIYQIIEQLEN